LTLTRSLEIPISQLQLENGLRVTISEDHTVPVVAINLWYHVGSANERPGRTGFAHLFEHMLFQGSAHVAANEHFELIQRAGGTLNGSTWLDRTNYFETVPSHQLALALWLEADRMGQLLPAMTQEKLDTQRDVVKNERRWSVDNRPYGTWWERMQALAFPPSHPFHHSLIGSMEDLEAASLEDISAFFRTYYTPDNAVLTIVGDVQPDQAERLIREYFGPIPRGPSRPPLVGLDVPERFGSWMRETVEDSVAVCRVFIAFRTPPFDSVQYHATSICGAILGTGRGSRLHQRLVREREVASAVSAFTLDLVGGADLMILDVTGRPDVGAARLEEETIRVVEELRTAGAHADDVGRARSLIETELVAALQAAGERADRLSQFATYFDAPRRLNDQLSRYGAVDERSVAESAHGYLGADNRVSLSYVPRSGEAAGE
jgi:zinc protease